MLRSMSFLLLLLMTIGCETKDIVVNTDEDTLQPQDVDQDGYDETEDCDDNNALVNIGAEEVCDNIDNNCDGYVDEGVKQVFYLDEDGDGFGTINPDNQILSCTLPEGYVPNGNAFY